MSEVVVQSGASEPPQALGAIQEPSPGAGAMEVLGDVKAAVLRLAGIPGVWEPRGSDLSVDWRLRTVPPAPAMPALTWWWAAGMRKSELRQWLRKSSEAGELGCEVAAIVPAATGARWWRQYVWDCADALCFLSGRPIKGHSYQCVVHWGSREDEFFDAFEDLGELARLRV